MADISTPEALCRTTSRKFIERYSHPQARWQAIELLPGSGTLSDGWVRLQNPQRQAKVRSHLSTGKKNGKTVVQSGILLY